VTAYIVVDSDPSKVDVAGYTFGDVLAADATGTLQPVAIGTDTDVLTADSTEAESVEWAPAGAGSSYQPVMRQAYITTGNVTIPNTGGTWTALAGFELSIPAAVGDYVDIGASFFLRPDGGTPFMDIGVIVGSSIVRAMSSGTATPAVEGMPAWYPTLTFRTNPAPMGFTVTAPDLDGGNIRWAIITNGNGVGLLFASVAGPFYWRSFNWKVVG
jgi:hypothetical protein